MPGVRPSAWYVHDARETKTAFVEATRCGFKPPHLSSKSSSQAGRPAGTYIVLMAAALPSLVTPAAPARRLHSSSTATLLPTVRGTASSSRERRGSASHGLSSSASEPHLVTTARPGASPTRAPRKVVRPPLVPSSQVVAALRQGHVLQAAELQKLKSDFRAARELAAVDMQYANLFIKAQGGPSVELQLPKKKVTAARNRPATGRPPFGPSMHVEAMLRRGHVLLADDLAQLKADYAAAQELAAKDPKYARLFHRAQGDPVAAAAAAVAVTSATTFSEGDGRTTTTEDPEVPSAPPRRVRDEAVLAWYLMYRERFGLAALEEGSVATGLVRVPAGATNTEPRVPPREVRAPAASLAPLNAEPRLPPREMRAPAASLAPLAPLDRNAATVASGAIAAAKGSTVAAEAARAAAQEARDAAVEARRRKSWQPLETVPGGVLTSPWQAK